MEPVTIEDMKKIIALSDLPDEQLQWIMDHSDYEEYEDGAIVAKTGEPIDKMMFILEGSLSFYLNVNGQLVHYFDFGNDTQTGGATGLLPYSRMKTSPGTSYAVGKLRGFRLHKMYFHELEQLNPDLIQRLIGYMTERARLFATVQLQHEKVSALGKLSAGIAHELNNPAAAINRISEELNERLRLNYQLTEKLLLYCISPEHIQNIRAMVTAKETEPGKKNKLTAFQRIEKEEEITEWLQKNTGKENHQAAETFMEAGFSIEDLETIRTNTGNESFIHVLYWLENLLSSERVIKDLGDASSRISTLVGAIKSHVHMDRTNDVQCTNIHNDIENTLTLLGYKIREKNISVKKIFCDNLPDIDAYIGELNQVWTNLIDNAIYALGKEGELTIETSCDKKNLTVRIIDNGTGIPREIVSRIFDPFFTTKKVGEGTGIGLDLVNRIIKRHKGEIKVNSVPGRTEFAVCIPVSQKQAPI